MASGDSSGSGSGSGGRMGTVLLALADAVVGAEAMDSLFAAVSVLASAHDLANGKAPSQRTARGEISLEIDVDDV